MKERVYPSGFGTELPCFFWTENHASILIECIHDRIFYTKNFDFVKLFDILVLIFDTEVKNCCPTGLDVFGMPLFSHQSVAAFSSRTSMSTWAFRMGLWKTRTFEAFFSAGKKGAWENDGFAQDATRVEGLPKWLSLIGILENSWNLCFGPLWRGTQRTYQMTVICSLVGSELSIS